MSRSTKKGPYVLPSLYKKVGHKLGEFAPTRKFTGHVGAKTVGK